MVNTPKVERTASDPTYQVETAGQCSGDRSSEPFGESRLRQSAASMADQTRKQVGRFDP